MKQAGHTDVSLKADLDDRRQSNSNNATRVKSEDVASSFPGIMIMLVMNA